MRASWRARPRWACSASSTRTPPSPSSAPCCAPTASTAPTPRRAAGQPAGRSPRAAGPRARHRLLARPRARARRGQDPQQAAEGSGASRAAPPLDAAEEARSRDEMRGERAPPPRPARAIDRASSARHRAVGSFEARPGSTSSSPPATSTTTPIRRAPPRRPGADVIAVIRSTAQSLIDYVPYGATTEGFGGTWATQENFRIVRAALDDEQEKLGRYLQQVELLVGAVHARDRLPRRRRAARHAAQRRDVRHPVPRHQPAPHAVRSILLAPHHRARRHHHQHRRGQLPHHRRRRREGAHRARVAVHQRGVRARAPACPTS